MPQPSPSLLKRAKKWIRHLARRTGSPAILPDEQTGAGFFTNATDFNINGGNFINGVNIGNFTNEWKINYINNVVSSQQAVFELLQPYTCLDATKDSRDSGARYPPPRCHHGTRLKIRERLMRWLLYEYDEWKMVWVRGSAGTGKSAVAQSSGDACGEEKKHGASYFFSRVAGRNKLETVVPTIAFQLATTVPEYRSLVGHQLANNPLLLRQSPPVQFRELIVEPFATLQRQHPRQPIVIILDSLDECGGEKPQLEILEMVTNAVRSNPNLPLRWLIFSRPEAHLKNAFSRNLLCGREELTIDAECREDVERYVKDRLVEIHHTYSDITPPDWPEPDRLQELLDAVSGLFVFASTCLNFVDDPDKADPVSQLDSLLTFMRRSQDVVSRNPLAVLDLLYSQILDKIPPEVYAITRRILVYLSHRNKLDETKKLRSAQALSNSLRLDRQAFTRLPEAFTLSRDFLLDPNRSGKFCIREPDALAAIVPSWVYWCEVDIAHFHFGEGWDFDYDHKHDCLPGLTWASADNRLSLSKSIATLSPFAYSPIFCPPWDCVDQAFFSRLSNSDFRFWATINLIHLVRLCRLDPSTSIARVEPSYDTDFQLLDHMNLVIGHGIARPAQLPLRDSGVLPDDEWIREYFFIGHGVKAVIVWRTKSPTSSLRYPFSLRSDQTPSQEQISKYAEYLREIEWDEARAYTEMK